MGAARPGGGAKLLEGLPAECIGAVASRLVYVDFCDGDVIYERRERADRMYFIVSGTVSLSWPATAAAIMPAAPAPMTMVFLNSLVMV